MADGKKENMAMSTGICSSMGRQPDSGLAPAREYSAIVSCCRFMAFSCPGYFSLMAVISGASTRMRACDLKLL